ncbi:hypothetical protein ABT124_37100 [Streptomyces sp. NPDC001982]|uniref:hypothetical protein n=1 Tax=Streptomyces sp. NPDC001982 TaxID=3154405 RepID=UPI00331A5F8D
MTIAPETTDWRSARRADKAAEAEQRRRDQDADAERRLRVQAAEDERRRAARQADKTERRAEEQQKRRDRRDRRRERAQAWAKNTTPENVYKRGTLALVAASALASLPAQVAHFAAISLMLLPLPFALEGAAWVMAAGVAYADERKLPAWVRWLLRALSMSAAAYAASINYSYGMQTAPAVGYGLAAVTMLGPLFFEVRQWVTTLSFDPAERKMRTEAKARAAHAKKRRKDHKSVLRLAERLVSAAPFGTLDLEDAFAAAWEIVHGTRAPGMTPALHAQAHASRKALATAFDSANGSPVSTRGRLLELLHPAPLSVVEAAAKQQVATDLPPASKKSQKTSAKGARRQPPPHRRTKGDALPFHPAAKTEAALERGGAPGRITAVNGHH